LVAEGRALRVVFGLGVLMIAAACLFVGVTVNDGQRQSTGVDVAALEKIAELEAQTQQARTDEALARARVEEIRAQGDADVERITANTDAHARRVLLEAQITAVLEGVERRRAWRVYFQIMSICAFVAACFFVFVWTMVLAAKRETKSKTADKCVLCKTGMPDCEDCLRA